MNNYQPTDEQLHALAAEWLDEGQTDHPDDRAFWIGEFRTLLASAAGQAIMRAAQAEALREARVTAEFGDTVPNDGEYEYTVTSDCDGSNVRYLRRKPKSVGEHHPWEPATEQAWAAARYPSDQIKEAADV